MLNLLEPRNLYRELFDFREDFEDIFNKMIGFTRIPQGNLLTETFVPPIEAWTDPENKKFHLRVAIPGIEPKDVKVEVRGKMLVITGERREVETKKELNYHHREFHYGAFERVLPLPEGVDAEKIVAEFNNGVLEIDSPLVAAALPRKIEIKPFLKKVA